MLGIDFLGLNLPFYLFITLMLSYIIYSKFLNKSKLEVKTINNFLDLLTIFLFILILLVGFVTLVKIIDGFLNLNQDMPSIVKSIPDYVSFFVIVIIMMFISAYRHIEYKKENQGKNELKKIFILVMIFLCVLLCFFILFYLILIFTIFGEIFKSLILFLPAIILFMGICYSIVDKVLFNINFFKDILDGTILKVIIITAILIGVGCIFLLPYAKYEKPINMEYHIYNYWGKSGEAYLKTRIPISIDSFGILKPIISFIPIYYGDYNLETTGIGNKNFQLIINRFNMSQEETFVQGFENIKEYGKNNIVEDGFTSIYLDEERKLLNLKFDYEKVKDERIEKIILEGYVKKNISNLDYFYKDNSDSSNCDNSGCMLSFNIENNLDLPVYHEDQYLFNFNSKNIFDSSKCKFNWFNPNITDDHIRRITESSCENNNCELRLKDETSKETFFEIEVVIDNGAVVLNHVKINRPTSAKVYMYISC